MTSDPLIALRPLGGTRGDLLGAAADERRGPASGELLDLRPGETAAVPPPFALPEDGGEAWLTLRVTTARD